MADVTRGFTFGATEEVTNTKLHNLIDAATVTNIDKDDTDSSNTSFIHIGSTSPGSPYVGLHWFDTSTNILKRYDGTVFVPVASADSMLLTNKSGGQVVAGDVVIVDVTTDESFTTTATANNQTVFGVALETISNNSSGTVAFSGKHKVNIGSAAALGEFIQTSSVVKEAQTSTTQDGGTFGIVLEAIGVSGLATCVLFGGNNFSLTNDIIDALNGAATPSSSNVFQTASEASTLGGTAYTQTGFSQTATSTGGGGNDTASHTMILATGTHLVSIHYSLTKTDGGIGYRAFVTFTSSGSAGTFTINTADSNHALFKLNGVVTLTMQNGDSVAIEADSVVGETGTATFAVLGTLKVV